MMLLQRVQKDVRGLHVEPAFPQKSTAPEVGEAAGLNPDPSFLRQPCK